MGAPIHQSDDRKPSESEPPKREPSIRALRNDDPLQASPTSDRAAKVSGPLPWRRNARRGVFEGDAAAVELHSRPAWEQNQAAARGSRAPRSVLRFAGFVMMVALAAGLAGYLAGGSRLKAKLTAPKDTRGTSSEATAIVAASPFAATADLNEASRDSQPSAVQPAAPSTPALQAASTSASLQAGAPLSAPPQSASEIAERLRIGTGLIASGDIAAARTMFERVAEAGDAAGAFALAETYDPAVIRTLRLRGGITANPTLALHWYERARDLGSVAASDRIARLAQNPR